ncbi:hypothetical protein KJ991_00900 [Patescibacteria group bacterium]|nr:hypothetical protein [Patescibacteria group bacterium]MBU4057792.1 hypothetical protein [Patescibacteria group bacterium]MBU4115968.1 hypothetical protein [Patescibacteria group bacterium]
MQINKYLLIFITVIFLVTLSFGNVSFAETAKEQVSSRRSQLENELSKLEQEIGHQQAILDSKKAQSQSLERDMAIIDAEIRKSELNIRAREITISKLSEDIKGKETTIVSLNEKIFKEKKSLAQLIKKRNEIDSFSLVEVILSNKNLSDFFEDVDMFTSIKAALSDSFLQIEETKNVTNIQKESLIDKRAAEIELKNIQDREKKKIEQQKAEKKQILSISKGQEAIYQKILKEKQKSAAEIRSELFTLRGSTAISFEKALEYANIVGKRSGVRPALILGVIAEESNLGQNVGTGNWKTDMHPTRDRPIFQEICERLGFDPDMMPVSKKPWYGWGGAMGPAQFIPSTWVMYEDKIAKMTGHNPPNPWDPFDAFTASAMLLADNGATKGTRDAERLAALRYFAGWTNATKSAYAFYGDEVMDLTDMYQKQIDILNQ